MKITLYNRDGSIHWARKCIEWNTYCGDFKIFVVSKKLGIEVNILEDYIVSNLPFAVEDQTLEGRGEDNDPPMRITLTNDKGEAVRVWEQAKDISFRGGAVTFKAGDDYITVFGNVVMRPVTK